MHSEGFTRSELISFCFLPLFKHYHWNYDVCVGARPGTGKWYMDYATGKCVRDCDGGDKCGGYAEDWEYLYDLKLTCCLQRKWWDILNC